jgi:hypothetical protein
MSNVTAFNSTPAQGWGARTPVQQDAGFRLQSQAEPATATTPKAAATQEPAANAGVDMAHHGRSNPWDVGSRLVGHRREPVSTIAHRLDHATGGKPVLGTQDFVATLGMNWSDAGRAVNYLGRDGHVPTGALLDHLDSFSSRRGINQEGVAQAMNHAASNANFFTQASASSRSGPAMDFADFANLAKAAGIEGSTRDLSNMFSRAAGQNNRDGVIDRGEFERFFGVRIGAGGDFGLAAFRSAYERQEAPPPPVHSAPPRPSRPQQPMQPPCSHGPSGWRW